VSGKLSTRQRWILAHQIVALELEQIVAGAGDSFHDDDDEDAKIRAMLSRIADRHFAQAAKLLERQTRCSGR
jgi:hypothetical protein